MNALFLDIETIPTPEAWKEASAKDSADGSDEEARKKLSFSACTARVLCMGYAFNGNPPSIAQGAESEILREFWTFAAKTNIFVGHNIMDFDLKFLWQRSIILGIRPTREIPFVRFRNAPIFDTMQEWSKWAFRDNVSLDTLARALGIASPKANGLDGSKVFEYYTEGRMDEILEYCKGDVEAVRQVYHRIRNAG